MTSVQTSAPPVSNRLGRPADRQDLIVEELRQLIVGGKLQPGSRLPTRPEIEGQYGAGTSTVQRALDKLKADGFIASSGRNGTHVVPHPPHLTRYALVMALRPTVRSWARYWTALVNEAEELERNSVLQMPIYYEVDGHADSPNYQRLLDDVRNHRLAGLIFPERPFLLENTALWETDVPRVTAGHDVRFDYDSFWSRACERLAAHGRKRVAFLTVGDSTTWEPMVERHTRSYGLETHPYWWQIPASFVPSSACNAVHMLFNPNQAVRPDALVIGDDNLVEGATAGLRAAGMRVPQDVEVIAHSNFPWPTNAVVPVQRLGFHARHILQQCIAMIDASRQNKPLQEAPVVAAQFEWEFENQP